MVSVAKVGKRFGLPVPFAERTVNPQCLLIARDGLGMPAEPVLDVAQTVPSGRRAEPVTDLLEQFQRAPAVDQRRPVIAEPVVAPAEGVERVGPSALAGPG